MKALGDFDASAVIYGKFTTFRPSTGAAFTLAGTPALSVYKDASTTQSTTGVTLTADFDSVTGLNHFAIDTSADGTFYAAGSFFDIVITTGTVDSVSVVGSVVASFTIRKTAALKPSTAGRNIVVDPSGLADATMVKAGPSGSGTAQTARDLGASVLLSSGTGTGQLDFTSGVVKSNQTQINGDATAAANVAKTTRAIGRGTVTSGGSTTSIPTSAFTPNGNVADQFKGRVITFDADTTTAALKGQSTDITASTNATNPTFTVTALTTAPSSGDSFSVT